MPVEKIVDRRARASAVLERLAEVYPEARSALDYADAFGFLIAVILSAQTTDRAVNQVTGELFLRWPDARALASAEVDEVAQVIQTIGIYRVKARRIVEAAQCLVVDFDGRVPGTMAELLRLPGVGRKTANVVLAEIFDRAEGIAVDTHVYRIAHRLKLVGGSANTPEKVERALMSVFRVEQYNRVNRYLVLFGREVCIARRARCEVCPLSDLCPSASRREGLSGSG